MNRPLLPIFLLAIASAFGSKGQAHLDERESLSAALGIELLQLDPAGSPDAAGFARISHAVGDDVDPARVDAFWGIFEKEGADTAVHIGRVQVSGIEPIRAVLFAVDEAGEFVAAAVVDGEGGALAAWTNFANNLRFAERPSLEAALPRAELARVRAEAEARGDADGHLTVALLDVVAHMNDQASTFNIPSETNPLTPSEQAAMMSEAYAAVAELSDALAPLLGEQTGRFAEIAFDSAEIAAEMATNRAGADAAQRKLFANCRACHNLEIAGGEVKDVFAEQRAKRGIGDGFFVVGHDLRVSHADRELAQTVADTMRVAALALEAAE